MSLRLRLFLVLAALFAGIAVLSAWGLRHLTADLGHALTDSALDVGQAVVTVLRTERSEWQGDASPERIRTEMRVERDSDGKPRVRHFVDGREVEAPLAEALRGALPESGGFVHGFSFDREGDAVVLRGGGIRRAIPVPRSGVDDALVRFRTQLLTGGAVLLAAALAVAALLAHRVAAPMRGMAEAARRVGEGAFGTQAPTAAAVPEIRATVSAFNRMSARLKDLEDEAGRLRAERELSELGEIGRGLAHSLRNPLNTLGLSLDEMARLHPEDAEARAMAVRAREAIARIDHTLRGFLALAAGEGAEPEPLDLRRIAEDVLMEAAQRADGRVHFSLDAPEPVPIRALAAELRILLHTLVINALEASPPGATVQVRLRAGPPHRVEVEDHGCGIPAEIRSRLFSPHVSSKADGAGMGLYLAERLASRRYRGRLVLENAPGGGTLAHLSLEDRTHG
ncbi:MAG TPA: HAMP domain-containing sensor histidine kinase [Xanthomonadaceae bacterium]|nr:HAMP domain-containing sensor histidine kinase [Xanthomonadaceae bacterium]